jgi:hypothetical protein
MIRTLAAFLSLAGLSTVTAFVAPAYAAVPPHSRGR